jgi:hypothetical protein
MAPLDDDKRLKEDRLIMVGLAIVAAALLIGVYFIGKDYREKNADKRAELHAPARPDSARPARWSA